MLRVLTALAAAGLLAACSAQTERIAASPVPAGPTVISGTGTAPVEAVVGPPGCAAPISEYQQIIDSDVQAGYLNPGVYNRIQTDLGPVKDACAAGREGEANSRLAAVKRQYGYR